MSCSTFDFLEFIRKLLLKNLIFIGFYVFEALILFKNIDIVAQFINKGSGSMLYQIICRNKYVKSFMSLLNIVLKCFNNFDYSF